MILSTPLGLMSVKLLFLFATKHQLDHEREKFSGIFLFGFARSRVFVSAKSKSAPINEMVGKLQPANSRWAIGVVFAAPAFASPVVRQTCRTASCPSTCLRSTPWERGARVHALQRHGDFQRFDPAREVLTGSCGTRHAECFPVADERGTGTDQTA